MGFLQPNLPDLDLEAWRTGTRAERMRPMARHVAEIGFGTPDVVFLMYVVKIGLYVGGGLVFALTTPPLGSFLYWLRPNTVRLPPWPGRVPLTRATRRTPVDVLLYAALLLTILWALLSPGPVVERERVAAVLVALALVGLRDKTIFLAARAEVYGTLSVTFLLTGADVVVAAKLVMLAIWWGAATSKLNRHFPYVVQAMMSNSPVLRSRRLKRTWHRSFPDDLRPSWRAHTLAHLGTAVEYAVPLALFLSHGGWVTTVAAIVMILFHLQILTSFPMGVPLEWNVFMIYGILTRFVEHAAYGLGDVTTWWPILLLMAVVVTTVAIGNLAPAKVSFLPGMRYYAGNWDTSYWCFTESALAKLDAGTVKASLLPHQQLEKIYGPEQAELPQYIGYAFRAMHSHGSCCSRPSRSIARRSVLSAALRHRRAGACGRVGLMTADAVVVGSGPNGLAAAITLTQRGLGVTVLERHDEIGGGTRTAELTVPGVLHDVCSAIHPFGVGSPFLRSLPLADHGLVWRYPAVDLAHPLDDGTAGVMLRDLDATVAGLGEDGERWRSVFGPVAERYDDIAPEVLGPVVHVPRHPVLMARFGLRAALPANVLARRFRTEAARALFGGVAAHIYRPLNRPTTAGIGVFMIAAGHRHGWPVAQGGSRAITDAMASLLRSLGGEIHTGVDVRSLAELPDSRIRLFDTTPTAFAAIAGRPEPRWRYGMGAYKLDLAVRDGVPWTAEACRRAGTVHVGGTFAEMAAAEARSARGELPRRPFVLVGQQYLADPSRSAGDVHPVWAYAHVPHGYDGDATDLVLDQIERFAPGLRERIVGLHVTTPTAFEAYNPNYVGGDIASGMVSVRQLVRRAPYRTGVTGTYLCSSSTAPGPGVHGMCGHLAARRALADAGR